MPRENELKHAFKTVLNRIPPHVLDEARRSFHNQMPGKRAIRGLPLEERLKLAKILEDARSVP